MLLWCSSMAIEMGVFSVTAIAVIALAFAFQSSPSSSSVSAAELRGLKPEFNFSWSDNKDAFVAGEIAVVRVVSSADKVDNGSFNPIMSVNGRIGNSSLVSDLGSDLGGNLEDWRIFFTAITSGLFELTIIEDNYLVNSSLRFRVDPGEIYPSVCVASWKSYTKELAAGSTTTLNILLKDAFGNNISSSTGDLTSTNFTLSAMSANGSVASSPNITRLAWNALDLVDIDFAVYEAGDFVLIVQDGNQALSGNPFPLRVNPGPLDVSNSVAKWNHEPNSWQLFSKMELFIHQQDKFGNLAPELYEFDAEVIERDTNLSVPVPDFHFEEVIPGVQLFSFSNEEPGNFVLKIFDADHNQTLSNMPYAYSVFVGYCNGTNSVVNGSGLNTSVAGETAEFSVYLRDSYQFSSLVEPERLQVQIVREIDSYIVPTKIQPFQITNDSLQLARRVRYDANSETEIAPSPSENPSNYSIGNFTPLVTAFNVVYTPEKSGTYHIHVFCGNIWLNHGLSFTKEVIPGVVNMSLSGIIKFDLKVRKQIKNEVIVQLIDSFHNPVLSQQSRLQLEIASAKNTSGFSSWMFENNNDGTYTCHYVSDVIGTFKLYASLDGQRFSTVEVNVYDNEYFPKASDDNISVWEDESVAFDALANDFFAGENASYLEFSEPNYGSLLQYGRLLRYTPHKDYYGNDSFEYTISDTNGNLATGSVNISVLSIPPQFIAFPTQLQATEDELSPKFGGFSGFELRYSDMIQNISVNISARSGAIYLSPMPMQFWPLRGRLFVSKVDTESKSLVLKGTVEVVNSALKSIQYLGNENFYGSDVVRLSTRNTHVIQNLDVQVLVDPINDPPFIYVPEFIILKSNENESLIYNPEKDKFDFSIGDPDLQGFPGDDSLFMVIFSIEVDKGFLSTTLPSELISTTELRTMNNFHWQPLQNYVTIAQHFTVEANGIRFRGSVNDCNTVMKQLLYIGTEVGTVLKLMVNDMGNYGCFPDCSKRATVPLYTEATVNLIRRRPMSYFVSRALGSAIVVESIAVLCLGIVLLTFTCKCALVLVHQRRTNNAFQPNNSHKGS